METKPKPNSGAIARAAQKMDAKSNRKTLQGYIEQMTPEIKKALPSVMTLERFVRISLSAVSRDPKLAECTPQSFLGAMMTAAQLGLEINTPLQLAWLIPRRNNKTGCYEAQFQMGYKGLEQLAYRNPHVTEIQTNTVYANDTFECEYGMETKLRHIPAIKERGEPIAFYAYFKTDNGGFGFSIMSVDDVRKHRDKYSEAVKRGNFSPWATEFEAMAEKTVLKKALKHAPLSVELQNALASDGAVRNTISEDMFSEPVVFVEAEAEDVVTAEEAVEVMSNVE